MATTTEWKDKPGIAPLVPIIKSRLGGEPDFYDYYNLVAIKTYIYNLYGNGADIMSPDGPGTILSLHGRAVYIALKSIRTDQVLNGRPDSTGGGLHRCYLHQEYNCPLIVRPLSSITDDEAVEVAYSISLLKDLKVIYRGENFVEVANLVSSISISFDGSFFLSYNGFPCYAHDILRQKGFALPIWWQGKSHSVEDLVNMQLFKIA